MPPPLPPPTPQSEERDPLAQLNTLPGPLRTFLFSRGAGKDLEDLYKKYQFPPDTLDAIVDIIGDIDLGYLSFSELLPALKDEAGLPEVRAKQFAADLAGWRYLPIAELLGVDVGAAIKSWGRDPKKFPIKTIETQKTTAPLLVDSLLAAVSGTLEPRLAERLRFVLLSRVQGVRDDTETKDILTRSQKVGGVELLPERAEEIMDELHRKLATAQIVAEMPQEVNHKSQITNHKSEMDTKPPRPTQQNATVVPRPRPSLSEALPAAQKFAGPGFEIPEEKPQKDEEEIAALRAALAERIPKNDSITRTRAASAENIVRASELTFADPALSERFKRIVMARLRDLRDEFETKRLLAQTLQTGGLALAADVADRVTNLIEAEHQAITGQGVALKQREAYALEATKQQAAETRVSALAASDAQAREIRFHKIAEKSKKLQEREILLPPSTRPETEHLVPTSNLQHLKVVLSPASVVPPPANKPKMEDVKVVRKIAGPLDELAAMTIVEFRRLSKDPREATLKIRDKIELLKEEGFDRYLAAVRAWQSSLPNRTYLALTREALGASATVTALIYEKSQTNQPTLTLDEFYAILALNSQLQL